KKNFINDMINEEFLDYTHYRSVFQFYYLEHLWSDIRTALNNNLKLLNITSEPIKAGELVRRCFHQEFKNTTDKPPAHYDVRSRYDHLYGGDNGYIYFKEDVVADLKNYLQKIDYRID
ncbi:MAG: pyridine nucleotide transhydrogenase, partial [Halanaerobiaceae bacterium]